MASPVRIRSPPCVSACCAAAPSTTTPAACALRTACTTPRAGACWWRVFAARKTAEPQQRELRRLQEKGELLLGVAREPLLAEVLVDVLGCRARCFPNLHV